MFKIEFAIIVPMSEPRYAIYYAPQEKTLLWQLASQLLGRDAATRAEAAVIELEGFDAERIRAYTKSPCHYGFHATLKPPFYLAEGKNTQQLINEMEEFASRQKIARLPNFHLSLFGRYIGIVLSENSPELSALADAAVRDFDDFRRPSSESELDERRKGLTPRQSELLNKWGYPYVFEEWQFHMSLASGLNDPDLANLLLEELTLRFSHALSEEFQLDAVCLYSQPSRTEPFKLLRRFPFSI